jgi:hypothetical protein
LRTLGFWFETRRWLSGQWDGAVCICPHAAGTGGDSCSFGSTCERTTSCEGVGSDGDGGDGFGTCSHLDTYTRGQIQSCSSRWCLTTARVSRCNSLKRLPRPCAPSPGQRVCHRRSTSTAAPGAFTWLQVCGFPSAQSTWNLGPFFAFSPIFGLFARMRTYSFSLTRLCNGQHVPFATTDRKHA